MTGVAVEVGVKGTVTAVAVEVGVNGTVTAVAVEVGVKGTVPGVAVEVGVKGTVTAVAVEVGLDGVVPCLPPREFDREASGAANTDPNSPTDKVRNKAAPTRIPRRRRDRGSRIIGSTPVAVCVGGTPPRANRQRYESIVAIASAMGRTPGFQSSDIQVI